VRAWPGSCPSGTAYQHAKRTRKRTRVVIGAWTHGHIHHAAVIDQQGRLLGDQQFPADRGGYRLLLSWLRRHGNLDAVGVEATGSYGAGLTRYLLDQHVADIKSAELLTPVGCVRLSTDGAAAPFIGIYASVSVSPWMRVPSCFAAGSFTRPLPAWPPLPAQQAFTEVSEELPATHAPRWASWARFLAALRSRSMTSPHPWQMKADHDLNRSTASLGSTLGPLGTR
jgi:Transposase